MAKLANIRPVSKGSNICLIEFTESSTSVSLDLADSYANEKETGLYIEIKNPTTLEVISHCKVSGKDIGIGSSISATLPDYVNDDLYDNLDKCNHKFKVSFYEYLLATGEKAPGASTVDYDASVIEDLVRGNTQGLRFSETSPLDNKEKDDSLNLKDSEVSNDNSQSNQVVPPPIPNVNASVPPIPAQKKSFPIIPLILGLVGLLIAILAALYFLGIFNSLLGSNQNQSEAVAPQQIEEPISDDNAQNTSANKACSLTDADDKTIIKDCLATSPSTDVLVALAKEAASNNRCDLTKRILSSYGRRNADVAIEFAKYYDPNSNVSSSCITKDIEQSKYWYKKAQEQGKVLGK